MAANVNNWNNWTRVPTDQSRHLRQQGADESRRAMQLATREQIKTSVRLSHARLMLVKPTNTNPLETTRTLSPYLQVQISSARCKDRVDIRQAASEAGSKHFIQSKVAAHKLGNLQNCIARPAHTAAQSKDAVVTKSHTSQADRHSNQTNVPTQVPAAPRGGDARAAKTSRQRTTADRGARRDNTAADAKPDKGLAATIKKGALPKSELSKGAEVAAQGALAGASAAVAGHKGTADGDKRTEKKDGEGADKKSSLATNAGKTNAKRLGRLLDGGGCGADVDCAAGDTAWQAGDSDAIGADAAPARSSLMDANKGAVTFNEPCPHDEVWNRNITYRQQVLKPDGRLREIAELNTKLGERLAEVALSERVVMSAAKDPALKQLLLSCMNRRTNAYGGMSG